MKTLEDETNFLEDKKICFDRIFFLCNFNISLNFNNDASRLWTLFVKEFGLIHHVKSQTHKSVCLLNHVISSGEILVIVKSNIFLTQSDHSLIFLVSNWKLSKPKPQMFYASRLLTASAASTLTLDRIPTRIVKSFPNELSAVVLDVIRFSLEKGVFLHALKKNLLNLTFKTLILILRILQTIDRYQTSIMHQRYWKDQLLYNLPFT